MNTLLSGSGVDLLGVLGFSWQDKVVDFLQKSMSFSSWAEKGRINTRVIDNLETEYLALQSKGVPPVSFITPPDTSGKGGDFDSKTLSLVDSLVSKTNVDESVVMNFLRAIWVLARDGAIPKSKVDPRGYQQSVEDKKSLPTEKGIADVLTNVGKASGTYSKYLLLIAGLGVGAYLLSQIKGFRNASRIH